MDEGWYTDDDSFEYDDFDIADDDCVYYGGIEGPQEESTSSDDDWYEEEGARYGAAQAAVGRRASGFSHGQGQTSKWYGEQVERSGAAEPGGLPATKTVRMIKCNSSENLANIARMEASNNTTQDEVVYYHGTTSDHAKDILTRGIDLTKSRSRQDFSNGNGFYVMKDVNKAIRWANKRASGGTGAIIAFKISRNLEKEEPHLSLDVQTHEGRALWTKIVSYYRKGGFSTDVPLLVQGKKFISGPVGRRNTTPDVFSQTCIRDTEYAKRYGRLENILFVMFIG